MNRAARPRLCFTLLLSLNLRPPLLGCLSDLRLGSGRHDLFLFRCLAGRFTATCTAKELNSRPHPVQLLLRGIHLLFEFRFFLLQGC